MRDASPTTAQGISWTRPLEEVCFQSLCFWSSLTDIWWWARDRGAVKCMTLHLWAANLKPFLVAHSCMAFTACCRCLSMVSRERPRKQIARSSTKSALKMSLAIQEGSSLIFPAFFIKPGVWFLGDGGCPWDAVVCGLGYLLDKGVYGICFL